MPGSEEAEQSAEPAAPGGEPSLQQANAEAFDELKANMAGRHLQVFPELLEFPMRLGTDTLLTASLRNASPSYIAFKVKTTATDRYRVRPNIGVVAPGETAHVKLVLVAHTEFTADLQHCRDRFLVQSLPVLPGQQPDSNAFKAQKFKVQDHKLRVSITQVHNAQNLIGDSAAGDKGLRPVASPLEKEIRSSLLAIAGEQGLDGHRSCLTKFSELLLLNGVISTQQMGVALDLVEALFEPEEEPEHMEELNRSVHTWIEESEHSGANSDDGLSSPSAAGMSAASSSFTTGPDRTPPPMISRSQLATVVSGVPAAADVFPSPTSTAQSRSGGRGGELQRSPPALRRSVDPATAKPQDLFPSPPATPTAQQNGEAGRCDGGAASPSIPQPHTPAMAGSDYKPPPLRRVEDAYAAEPDSVVTNASTSAASGARAPGMPPDTFPYGSSVKGGALNRNSADDGSGRSDILMDLLPAKVSATSSGGSFTDRPVPESPARNLAAMLRSTLRNPGPAGQNLRDAFTQGASPERSQRSAEWGDARESFSPTAGGRRTIEGIAEA